MDAELENLKRERDRLKSIVEGNKRECNIEFEKALVRREIQSLESQLSPLQSLGLILAQDRRFINQEGEE